VPQYGNSENSHIPSRHDFYHFDVFLSNFSVHIFQSMQHPCNVVSGFSNLDFFFLVA
jgi:hypothetical protein